MVEQKEKEEVKKETSSEKKPLDQVKRKKVMSKLMQEIQSPPQDNEIVEGPVIKRDKNRVFIDLHPFGTGIIYGREFANAKDILSKTSPGEVISSKVLESENKEGYIELSLKEARQEFVWAEAEDAIKNKTVFELLVKDANKGGLILEWQGVSGFLPASQLREEHYPNIEDGDKDKIHEELKNFIGERIPVSIISTNKEEEKLIFSEKELNAKEKEEIVGKYNIGDVVEGEITGIVDFGAFVKIEEGLEGLIHISEIDWGLVEDPNNFFTEGDKVETKIIEIQENKISLSTKALKENPWQEASKKYKKGESVTGVIIKYNKHGALASIEEGVAGLVHVSEFESTEKLKDELELGKAYTFKITFFEPEKRQMALSYKEANKPDTANDVDSEEKNEAPSNEEKEETTEKKKDINEEKEGSSSDNVKEEKE